jgi:hypothetical protein
MTHQAEVGGEALAYEAPALTVIGSAQELTQGPVPGAEPDAVLTLHNSP